jgi:Rrf2 family protein
VETILSQTAEHALRALLYLARTGGADPVPVEAIAAAIGAPRNYLSKTLHALTKHGLVAGTRGPGGGYRLRVDPADLPVSRIAEAFAQEGGSPMCLLGGRPCDALHPCTAHARWTAVRQASLAPLRRTTLADLLGAAELAQAS